MTFRLLFVCTGNICRSPLAERLWTAWSAQRWPHEEGGVLAASAGTAAVVGSPVTPETAALVVREGGDPAGHVARALVAPLLEEADVVLGMTRRHRSAAVRLHPPAVQKAFTLREAARLAAAAGPDSGGDTPADRWRSLLPALRVARGRLPAPAEGEDDVVDPFGRSPEVYERSAGELLPALRLLLDLTAGD